YSTTARRYVVALAMDTRGGGRAPNWRELERCVRVVSTECQQARTEEGDDASDRARAHGMRGERRWPLGSEAIGDCNRVAEVASIRNRLTSKGIFTGASVRACAVRGPCGH